VGGDVAGSDSQVERMGLPARGRLNHLGELAAQPLLLHRVEDLGVAAFVASMGARVAPDRVRNLLELRLPGHALSRQAGWLPRLSRGGADAHARSISM